MRGKYRQKRYNRALRKWAESVAHLNNLILTAPPMSFFESLRKAKP